MNSTKSSVEAEIDLTIQKGMEAEARGRRELEGAYCQGFDEGFASGMLAGYEKGRCETWDEAYSSGYKAAKEEAAGEDAANIAVKKEVGF